MDSFLRYFSFSYRDFRESTDPYSEMSMFWNVTAARLAFIIVFEHAVFFTVYLMQWLVPDVPRKIQNKIDHERYIDQHERWASETNKDHFKDVAIATDAMMRMFNAPNRNTQSPTIKTDHKSPTIKTNGKSPTIKTNGKSPTPVWIKRKQTGVRISPQDKR